MSRQNGFSLIEVIVTMAIAAIVLSIGIPSFQSYTQNNRQTIAVNGLATALQLARNSAISRRVPVTLCKSPNGINCVTGGGSGDWSQGWMMFTNPNDIDGVAGLDPDTGEELLRVHGALDGDVSFSGNNNVTNRITFDPRGISLGGNGTILHCDSRGSTAASALVISIGGQVRQAVDGPDSDSIVEVQTVNVSCP